MLFYVKAGRAGRVGELRTLIVLNPKISEKNEQISLRWSLSFIAFLFSIGCQCPPNCRKIVLDEFVLINQQTDWLIYVWCWRLNPEPLVC